MLKSLRKWHIVFPTRCIDTQVMYYFNSVLQDGVDCVWSIRLFLILILKDTEIQTSSFTNLCSPRTQWYESFLKYSVMNDNDLWLCNHHFANDIFFFFLVPSPWMSQYCGHFCQGFSTSHRLQGGASSSHVWEVIIFWYNGFKLVN